MPITCPYCMEPIDKGTVQYECPQCGEVYKAAGLFHNKMPVCKNKAAHPSTLVASVIRCPHCHERLPADYLDYDRSLKFSLVGTTNSGKTNFMISMLHELMHAMKTGLAISPLDTTRDYYRNFKQMEKQMFIDHELLQATAIGDRVEPYLWRIRDRNKAKGTYIPSYSLTIYDNAGENFATLDQSENTLLAKYLCDTKTLFILIDPLQLPSFRERGQQDNLSSNGMEGQDATDSVQKVASFLRTNLKLGASALIDMNVAIIFTKIDAIGDENGSVFGDADLIYSHGDQTHIGCYNTLKQGFDKKLAENISNQIRQYLEDNEGDFLSALESSFVQNKIHYFGCSALGNPPMRDSNGRIFLQHIDPIRVLDPFLWMMVQEGLIKEI